MKLIKYLLSKFYKAQIRYYEKKSDDLIAEAKELWRKGEDFNELAAQSSEASAKAIGAFEKYVYLIGVFDDDSCKEYSMDRPDGSTMIASIKEEES